MFLAIGCSNVAGGGGGGGGGERGADGREDEGAWAKVWWGGGQQ